MSTRTVAFTDPETGRQDSVSAADIPAAIVELARTFGLGVREARQKIYAPVGPFDRKDTGEWVQAIAQTTVALARTGAHVAVRKPRDTEATPPERLALTAPGNAEVPAEPHCQMSDADAASYLAALAQRRKSPIDAQKAVAGTLRTDLNIGFTADSRLYDNEPAVRLSATPESNAEVLRQTGVHTEFFGTTKVAAACNDEVARLTAAHGQFFGLSQLPAREATLDSNPPSVSDLAGQVRYEAYAEPRLCPDGHLVTSPDQEYCGKCGSPVPVPDAAASGVYGQDPATAAEQRVGTYDVAAEVERLSQVNLERGNSGSVRLPASPDYEWATPTDPSGKLRIAR